MNIDAFLVGDSYCFINEFVEAFYLALGLGVPRCYLLVPKSNFTCKFLEVVGVERWSIICLNTLLYSMRSEHSLHLLTEVDLRNSLSGYLEYWSVTTNTYSLLGNGPQKSASTVSQILSGRVVIFAGSVTWRLKHVLTIFSILLFIPGNQYFFRISSLVFVMPGCPCLCAIVMILSLSDSAGMIRSNLSKTLSAV